MQPTSQSLSLQTLVFTLPPCKIFCTLRRARDSRTKHAHKFGKCVISLSVFLANSGHIKETKLDACIYFNSHDPLIFL
ncbi:hypothetical protein GDO81_007808 [Engystomops pustulosus]|uniref:Uncharacterized protein n=1 Tax=Engystomops pustulosus TaxID=76066 RepID=A0AAV7C9U0_ENGPU|nr:hypothetical protein GDO81_007808 [Engystomops pustulosus]